MRKISALLAGTAIFGAAAAAQAALVVNPAFIQVTMTPVTVTTTGYTGYVVNIATTDGSKIQAVDFSTATAAAANGVGYGFGGTLNQAWGRNYDADTGDEIAPSPTPNATTIAGRDSHVVYGATATVVGGTVAENMIGTSPNTDTATLHYGTGTFVKGAWGLSDVPTSANVAYLVVPTGTSPAYDGAIALSTGTFEVVSPEPASLSVLALGAAGLIHHHRA